MTAGPAAVETSPEDSLGRRYAYKLGVSFAGLGVSLLTQTVIPRGLGPAAYGSFNFLTSFFTSVVEFLDSGTSIGFFGKLSQRPREAGLVRFYWRFVTLVSVVLAASASAVFAAGWQDWLWPEQGGRYVWLALVWALLSWYNQVIGRMVDAHGLTVPGEVARLLQKAIGLALVLAMFWLDRFSLADFFIYQYVILLLLSAAWWRVMREQGRAVLPPGRIGDEAVRRYTREFYDYSSPLLTYALVGMVAAIADRWLLQRFGGSIEQGFFSLSFQLGVLCFMFTSAMTPLFMREMARSFEKGDQAAMRAMFERYVPALYTVATFFGVFLAVEADSVVRLFGGASYRDATTAAAVMALYPVHRTYGQLSGSVFYATGQTRAYRNIGLAVMPVGLAATYFLLAPRRVLGLELGATGLALKVVLTQVLHVNLQLRHSARMLDLSFSRLVGHQICSLALLGAAAVAARAVADAWLAAALPAAAVAAVVYALLSGAIVYAAPALVAASRDELRTLGTRALATLFRVKR